MASNSFSSARPAIVPVLVLACSVLGASAIAQAPAAAKASTSGQMPDAQIEANVLKGLAGAPDLANQSIATTTVYGTVTLTGTVASEAMRAEAETIASKAAGVQKVVDEVTLGTAQAVSSPDQAESQPLLQSDGTMAPAPSAQNAPEPGSTSSSDGSSSQQIVTAQPQQQGPPPPPAYGPSGMQYRRPYPAQRFTNAPPQQPGEGYPAQQAGLNVTIPSGVPVRIRINQALNSGVTKAGTEFDGVVVNDVIADGAVAIPRGASVQGVVVGAKKSGVLLGRGELSLQLTQVTLGARSYPIVSDVWSHHGGDKTIQTVNSTAVGGGVGALFGALAGGGAGAAIGAGVGGALGLGSSAASGSGQLFVPSEGLLTFHIAQPTTVATVSQEEMNRLSQGVPQGGQAPPPVRRRFYYPAPYYGPVFYRPYYPYPY